MGRKKCLFLKNWPARKCIHLQTGGWSKTCARHRNCRKKSLMVKDHYQLFTSIVVCVWLVNDQWLLALRPIPNTVSCPFVYRPSQWSVHRQVWLTICQSWLRSLWPDTSIYLSTIQSYQDSFHGVQGAILNNSAVKTFAWAAAFGCWKEPKCEIFDLFDFNDFYAIKSL